MGGGRQVQGEGTYVCLQLVHEHGRNRENTVKHYLINKKGQLGGQLGHCCPLVEDGGVPVKRAAGKEPGRQATGVARPTGSGVALPGLSREPQAPSHQGSAFLLNHPKCSTNISSHPMGGVWKLFLFPPTTPTPNHPQSSSILEGRELGPHSSRDALLHTHTPCWGRCLAQDPGALCLGRWLPNAWGSSQSTFPVSAQGALSLCPAQPSPSYSEVAVWRQAVWEARAGRGWSRGGGPAAACYNCRENPNILAKCLGRVRCSRLTFNEL